MKSTTGPPPCAATCASVDAIRSCSTSASRASGRTTVPTAQCCGAKLSVRATCAYATERRRRRVRGSRPSRGRDARDRATPPRRATDVRPRRPPPRRARSPSAATSANVGRFDDGDNGRAHGPRVPGARRYGGSRGPAPRRESACSRSRPPAQGAATPTRGARSYTANAYELLVATILSAQCTDERVNMVTPDAVRAVPDAGRPRPCRSRRRRGDHPVDRLLPRQDEEASSGWRRPSRRAPTARCPTELDELATLPGVGPQDRQRRALGVLRPPRPPGRHARDPTLAAAETDDRDRPGEDRARARMRWSRRRSGAISRCDSSSTAARCASRASLGARSARSPPSALPRSKPSGRAASRRVHRVRNRLPSSGPTPFLRAAGGAVEGPAGTEQRPLRREEFRGHGRVGSRAVALGHLGDAGREVVDLGADARQERRGRSMRSRLQPGTPPLRRIEIGERDQGSPVR